MLFACVWCVESLVEEETEDEAEGQESGPASDVTIDKESKEAAEESSKINSCLSMQFLGKFCMVKPHLTNSWLVQTHVPYNVISVQTCYETLS